MQDAGTPILGYAPSPKEGLTLEEEDGRAVVTFPVAPKWLYVLPIVVQLFGALMGVAMATLLLVVVVRLHVPISRSLVGVMAVLVSAAMASASVGVHSWFI